MLTTSHWHSFSQTRLFRIFLIVWIFRIAFRQRETKWLLPITPLKKKKKENEILAIWATPVTNSRGHSIIKPRVFLFFLPCPTSDATARWTSAVSDEGDQMPHNQSRFQMCFLIGRWSDANDRHANDLLGDQQEAEVTFHNVARGETNGAAVAEVALAQWGRACLCLC